MKLSSFRPLSQLLFVGFGNNRATCTMFTCTNSNTCCSVTYQRVVFCFSGTSESFTTLFVARYVSLQSSVVMFDVLYVLISPVGVWLLEASVYKHFGHFNLFADIWNMFNFTSFYFHSRHRSFDGQCLMIWNYNKWPKLLDMNCSNSWVTHVHDHDSEDSHMHVLYTNILHLLKAFYNSIYSNMVV